MSSVICRCIFSRSEQTTIFSSPDIHPSSPQCTKDIAGKCLKNHAYFHILFVDIPFAHVSNAAIGQDAPLEIEELARFSVPDALKTLACNIISLYCCNLFLGKRFGLCHLLGPRLARRGCAGLDRGQNGQV